MRVLVIHNRYRDALPSGENAAVDAETEWLRSAGVDVTSYIRRSDEIADFSSWEKARLLYRPIISSEDTAEVHELLRTVKPDVMHVHNVFPLISPWVLRTAAHAGVPTVLTVHNYRLVCAKGTFFRQGSACHDCVGLSFPWPAVVHACYRNSRAASLPIASALSVHRRTWRSVDRFVAPSDHVARFLQAVGVEPSRICVKGNGIPDPGASGSPGKGFVFLGRLDEEKGIRQLLQAWQGLGEGSVGPLTIVGDGPLRPLVDVVAQRRSDVTAVGALPHAEAMSLLDRAAVLVAPSMCEETFGRTIVEALARGRPALVTNVGAPASLVDSTCGWVVEPTTEAIQAGLVDAATAALDTMSRAARCRFTAKYSADRTGEILLDLYRDLSPVGSSRMTAE